VEDLDELRELVSIALTTMGFEALSACHGREALQILDQRPVDLVILDLNMPVLNGLAFLAERPTASFAAAVPIVIFSSEPNLERLRGTPGVVAVFDKATEMAAMLATVGTLLETGP
jgi:DNA-binding response OmpR family regulator